MPGYQRKLTYRRFFCNQLIKRCYYLVPFQPQNVMFKNEGGSKIKLIDFSLTRKFDPQQETKISFGTAEYVGKLCVRRLQV